MKLPYYIPTLIAFGASVSITQAAVTVTAAALAPAENVEASNTTGTSGVGWRNYAVGDSRDIGQSFIAQTSFTLDSFSFLANSSTFNGVAAGKPFTFTLYENEPDEFDVLDLSVLGTEISGGGESGSFINSYAKNDWLTFDVEDVELTAGNAYTLFLSWDSSVANQNVVFVLSSSNPYADGRGWTSVDGAALEDEPTWDFVFSVNSVPEPSTAGLLVGLGALAMCACRRQSSKD